jgi:hyperosmotically inducible protein
VQWQIGNSLHEFNAALEHLERAMKAINILRLAGSALIVVASINAWPQTSESDATSAQSSNAPAAQGSAKSTRQANRALSKRVRAALLKGGIDASKINVVAKSGAVTLAGSVTDSSQIDSATDIAKTVPGVKSVKNTLGIQTPGM